MSELILASGSPRRKEILENQEISFRVVKSTCDEASREKDPASLVLELSGRKAENVAGILRETEGEKDCLILAADTVVALEGRILGKPADRQQAEEMLRSLSGRTHQVYTGVTLLHGQSPEKESGGLRFSECTSVTMYPISDEEIRDYIASGEPMDKAGSYAIQGLGGVFVEKIDGDYSNVVGLPMARLYQECRKAGIDLRRCGK